MSNTPHTLDEEFPDMRERISALKTSDGHFARLAEEYHEVNRQVHRIETRVEPASDDVEEELKRRRVRLKTKSPRCFRARPNRTGPPAPAPARSRSTRPASPAARRGEEGQRYSRQALP